MRTGMPNYRLSRCGLCKEIVLYTEVILQQGYVCLDHLWNLITVWPLHRGGVCTQVILRGWSLSIP